MNLVGDGVLWRTVLVQYTYWAQALKPLCEPFAACALASVAADTMIGRAICTMVLGIRLICVRRTQLQEAARCSFLPVTSMFDRRTESIEGLERVNAARCASIPRRMRPFSPAAYYMIIFPGAYAITITKQQTPDERATTPLL